MRTPPKPHTYLRLIPTVSLLHGPAALRLHGRDGYLRNGRTDEMQHEIEEVCLSQLRKEPPRPSANWLARINLGARLELCIEVCAI